jgi:Domain of unknown function (DUF1707)
MATQPSLRIGDRERDAVAAELREHYAHGRLTLEEFNQRIDAVFAAKTQSDLSRLTADLPHVRSGGAPLPSSGTGRSPRLASGPPLSGGTAGGGSPATAWHGGSWHGGNWSGGSWSGRNHRRGGFAAFSTLLAAVASWLLVYDVLLVGVRFPWPGRVGLLVAIFTLIRGLLRRIFRGARRR